MATRKGPWKTDQWFVSPWNYVEEVTKDFTPPQMVKIHDTTLRDGEQQAGLMFTEDEKTRIATKLAELGVHRIEAGTPAVSPHDEAAIREIVKRKLGPEIFCLSRCMRFAERSTATTCAPAAASCAVLPPGAAHRSITRLPRTSPSSRAGSRAAASCTHHSPSS